MFSFLKRSKLSPEEPDGHYDIEGIRLYRDGFNLSWLVELNVQPEVIVDVGSYDGGDAIRFKLAYPTARVVAIEADPDRAPIVRSNAEQHGVVVIEAAAFKIDGSIPWYQATINGLVHAQGSAYLQTDEMNERYPHVCQKTVPRTVPAVRLDSIFSHIDVLHVDAQGSEYDVLIGLGDIRPAIVFLETMDGWVGAKSVKELCSLMQNLGYVLGRDLVSDRLYIRKNLFLRWPWI